MPPKVDIVTTTLKIGDGPTIKVGDTVRVRFKDTCQCDLTEAVKQDIAKQKICLAETILWRVRKLFPFVQGGEVGCDHLDEFGSVSGKADKDWFNCFDYDEIMPLDYDGALREKRESQADAKCPRCGKPLRKQIG